MVERPETRYVKSGDLHIAYQVSGDRDEETNERHEYSPDDHSMT